MRWHELAVLDDLGFSIYDKKALACVCQLGVADAATLCREGEIPTSKIYRSMEKLAALDLVETQPSRPRLWAARGADEVVDRLVDVARSRADRFAGESSGLRDLFRSVQGRVRGRQAFADLAIGVESHGKRHLSRLATAERRVLSYLEQGDLDAFDSLAGDGFPVLRRISRHAERGRVDHRVIF
jgi:sugar-specific transcriptional regulator TrmB